MTGNLPVTGRLDSSKSGLLGEKSRLFVIARFLRVARLTRIDCYNFSA